MSYVIEALVGFFGVIAGTAVSWGYMKARVTGLYEWRTEHMEAHDFIERKLSAHGEAIAVLKDRVIGKAASAD